MALILGQVSKRYGSVEAVRDVSFTVQAGRVCGMLSSNGAGKTTTKRMILRMLLPDEGSLSWKSAAISDTVRQGFGYLPEERG